MKLPDKLDSVLAKIEHQTELGKSTWYEVVYFDGDGDGWRSYHGSDTFYDGERVVAWEYAKDCFNNPRGN